MTPSHRHSDRKNRHPSSNEVPLAHAAGESIRMDPVDPTASAYCKVIVRGTVLTGHHLRVREEDTSICRWQGREVTHEFLPPDLEPAAQTTIDHGIQ